MNRNGSVARGRKGPRARAIPGRLRRAFKFAEGAPVKINDIIVEWDPYTFSILTEVGGTVQFKDLEQGVTLHEEVDEVTGLSRWVVTDSPRRSASRS